MPKRYLDPKIDLVFRKIFSEHPKLLTSFLNAILPLPEGRYITELSYLPADQVPTIPHFKHTIADVKCKDQTGDIFIVEMQVQWTANFDKRLLYGASRAYVNQLSRGEGYEKLNRVFGVGLLDDIYDQKSNEWYHHFQLEDKANPSNCIDDIQMLLIELPKFKPQSLTDKKMLILWLRFMSELNEQTREIPTEWLSIPEIKEAVSLAEEAAYTPEELVSYEAYWDSISTQKTYVHDAKKEGVKEGIKEGIEKGVKEGIEKGMKKSKLDMAKNLLIEGLDLSVIAKVTELSIGEIENLK